MHEESLDHFLLPHIIVGTRCLTMGQGDDISSSSPTFSPSLSFLLLQHIHPHVYNLVFPPNLTLPDAFVLTLHGACISLEF